MPTPLLSVDWADFDAYVTRLASLVTSLSSLRLDHRKLVAEIILLHLFFLLENTMQSVCGKLLSGASYLDTSVPRRIVVARSSLHAYTLMQTHGRAKAKSWLSWSQASDIRENLKYTLRNTDPLFSNVAAHAALLTEMRFVRNHIAHNNDGTRRNFRKVLQRYYGGVKRGVTPGGLLLTPALGAPPLLQRYLVSSRVFIKSLVRG